MSEDQYLKLFKFIQTEFKRSNEDIDEVKDMIRSLQGSVDAYAKQVLDVTQEHLMLARKVDRMEGWIQKIAAKTGVALDY